MHDAGPLIREMGYEVWETPDAVLFCDRRISMLWFWRIFVGGWAAALLVVAPAVGLTLALRGQPEGYAVLAISAVAGSVCGLATYGIHRALERRRSVPLAEVPTIASIDRASSTLRVDGETVASCAEGHASIELAIGDSSRGVMRWVVVRARGRKLRLFKTSSIDTARDVVDVLRRYGIDES